jgi:hypothetical protein
MKLKLLLRQGDVLLRQISQLPPDAKRIPANGRIILAHGEATGHHHSILSQEAAEYTTGGGGRVVDVKAPTDLVHQEHTALPVPVGQFAIERQREYTPAAIRNVAD